VSAGTRETAASRGGAGSEPPVFGFSTTAVQTAVNQCVGDVGRLGGDVVFAVNGLRVSDPGRMASSSWKWPGVWKRRGAAPGVGVGFSA
jgi:hypothetical protein